MAEPSPKEYHDKADVSARRIAKVYAAALLDTAQRHDQAETLRQEIRAKFNKEPVLETRIDAELIAGMVVQVGDWKLDSSIRSRLQAIREQLVERSSYEIQSRRDRFSPAT